MDGYNCAVTGACGFLGSHLVAALLQDKAARVRGLDVLPAMRDAPSDSAFDYVSADIRSTPTLEAAFAGVDTVFHTASYFGSPAFASKGFGDDAKVFEINYHGTLSVIKACLGAGVKRLIYISSAAALFTGDAPMDEVTEDEPLPEPHAYIDAYSASKARAENAVRLHNGRGGLATSVIRPNGIWGPSDACVALTRMLSIYKLMGGIYVDIGAPDVKSDWVHVDNLTYGCRLLASQLTDSACVPAGQVYHMNDDHPLNTTQFAAQMVADAGYVTWPVLRVPDALINASATAMEYACYYLQPVCKALRPMLTRMEARKVLITNNLSCAKAKRELGYSPLAVELLIKRQAAYVKANHALTPVVKPHATARAVIITLLLALIAVSVVDSDLVSQMWTMMAGVLALSGECCPAFEFWQSIVSSFLSSLLLSHAALATIALVLSVRAGANVPQWTALSLLYGPFALASQLSVTMHGHLAHVASFSLYALLVAAHHL